MNHDDLIITLTEAFNSRDADRLADALHSEVELVLASASEPIRGREAARAWYREAFERRGRFTANAESEARPDGSYLLRGRVNWFDNHGGRDQEQRWVVEFRDDLVISIRSLGAP